MEGGVGGDGGRVSTLFYSSISPFTSLKVALLHTLDNGCLCIAVAQDSLVELNMASLS